MVLPKGITGFYRSVSAIDKKLTEKIQKELKQHAYCKVLEIISPGPSNNYYTLELEYYSPTSHKQSFLSLLINGYARLWAMVETEKSSWMNLYFIEPPKEIKAALTPFLEEVSIDTLQKKINFSHIADLGKDELKQISYWKSERLGEIIFNGYD